MSYEVRGRRPFERSQSLGFFPTAEAAEDYAARYGRQERCETEIHTSPVIVNKDGTIDEASRAKASKTSSIIVIDDGTPSAEAVPVVKVGA